MVKVTNQDVEVEDLDFDQGSEMELGRAAVQDGDLESQGSYMVKANNANLDDMQSMGSYMVVQRGPSEPTEDNVDDAESEEMMRGGADDMQSNATYLQKGADMQS